jgi:hypothetical protein
MIFLPEIRVIENKDTKGIFAFILILKKQKFVSI